MIYTFRIVSDESDDFMREVKIDADSTFADLRDAVINAAGYEPVAMSSFFICENGWERGREITQEDMGSDADQDVNLMDEAVLSDMLEDEGDRLIFVFDYMTDRCFFMELRSTEPGSYLDHPETSRSEGEAPHQHIELDDFTSQLDAKEAKGKAGAVFDLDDDFYGTSEFNDDEFDAGSFDEMDLSDNTL